MSEVPSVPIVPVESTHQPVEPVTTSSSSAQCLTLLLLTWKNPAETAKVFGSIIVGLFVFKTVNLVNVFFHLAYIGLLISAAVEYAGKFVTGQGFVTKYKPANSTVAKKINDEVLPLIAKFNTQVELELQKIFYSHDIETTLKAAGLSYIAYKITSWLSFFNIIATAVVLAFTVPGIYLQNKTQIDEFVAQKTKCAKAQLSVASKRAGEYTASAQEKAAPFVNDLIKKTGPVGSFIQSKFPTRTAGSTVGDNRSTTFGTKADVPSTASTSGASKFPDVPTDLKSTVEEPVHDVKVPVPSQL